MIERGKLISFEGGEGCGKSTQAKLFAERIRTFGIEAILTREPGGSEGAELIRELLITRDWSPSAEFLLFVAARVDHYEKLIQPALEKGVWVVTDRYCDSSFVYQGIVRGFGFGKTVALHNMVFGGTDFYPDLTVILHIEAKEGLRRAQARGTTNRFEKYPLEFHQRVNEAYEKLPGYFRSRFLEYYATCSVGVLSDGILRAVLTRYYGDDESKWPNPASA